MYKLHICGEFNHDGLVSSTTIFEGTREECWAEHDRLMLENNYDLYLVQKPDWSNCAAGYPTRWDDPPHINQG